MPQPLAGGNAITSSSCKKRLVPGGSNHAFCSTVFHRDTHTPHYLDCRLHGPLLRVALAGMRESQRVADDSLWLIAYKYLHLSACHRFPATVQIYRLPGPRTRSRRGPVKLVHRREDHPARSPHCGKRTSCSAVAKSFGCRLAIFSHPVSTRHGRAALGTRKVRKQRK
jgi:hypothetical protein